MKSNIKRRHVHRVLSYSGRMAFGREEAPHLMLFRSKELAKKYAAHERVLGRRTVFSTAPFWTTGARLKRYDAEARREMRTGIRRSR